MRPGLLLLAAASVAGAACAKPAEQHELDRSRVNIQVICNGPGFRVFVSQYAAAVPRNGQATWALANEQGAVGSVTIVAKDPANWPFDQTSYTVPKGGEVNSGNVKTGAAARTYPYLIKTTCSFPDAPNRPIEIDPDMIIIDSN